MTFKEYLASQKPKSDPVGDLIRLASSDEFPEIRTLAEMQIYLRDRFGLGAISDAAATSWKAYEASLRKASR